MTRNNSAIRNARRTGVRKRQQNRRLVCEALEPRLVLSGLSLINAYFFGGAGDQRGTDVEIQGEQLYASVNTAEEQAETASSALLKYHLPTWPSTGPEYVRPWNLGVLNGIAATDQQVFAGGFSHPDAGLTLDGYGTTEVKSLLVNFNSDNASGAGPGGSDWAAKVPVGTFNDGPGTAFFYYTGVESFNDVATLGSHVYAVGHAQPFSHTTHVIAKYDSAGTIVGAATATEGIYFNMGSGPVPSGAKGAMYGVVELDGYLYAAGGKQDGNGAEMPTVWKYDSNLALQWQMQIPIPSSIGRFNGITTDGTSIYAVGEAGEAETDYFMAKFDQQGQVDWQGDYDNGGAVESLRDAIVVDGRLFTVGVAGETNDTDMAIAEIDPADGSLISGDAFGGVYHDAANRIAAFGPDLYVIGESRSFDEGGNSLGENDAVLLQVRTFNTPPDITSLSLNQPAISENENATLLGTFADPDQLDDFTVTVDWADANNPFVSMFDLGTANELATDATFNSTTAGDTSTILKITAIDHEAAQFSFEVSRRYLDDGVAPGNGTVSDESLIQVVVADDAGGSGASVATPSGTLFQAAFGLGGAGSDEIRDTEFDAYRATYVTGQFSGTVEFNNVGDSYELTSLGSTDMFVAKYNEDGSPVWVRQMGGAIGEATGIELASDAFGNVYVSAVFTGTVDLDPGPNTRNLTSNGSIFEGANAAILKLDTGGNLIWARHINGAHTQAMSVDIDSMGNLYVGGSLWGSADFDTEQVTAGDTIVSAGSQDGYLAKFSPEGQFI